MVCSCQKTCFGFIDFFFPPSCFKLASLIYVSWFSISLISILYYFHLSVCAGFISLQLWIWQLCFNISIWYNNFPSKHCFDCGPQILIRGFIFLSTQNIFLFTLVLLLTHGSRKYLVTFCLKTIFLVLTF